MKLLVTGGTVFVSRYLAEYFRDLGNEVYVLNRGSKPQSNGVIHIKGDRNNLGELLRNYYFDVVLDLTAYNKNDVINLNNAIGGYGTYIFLSSSAVYPEDLEMPFKESDKIGPNKYWTYYGLGKVEAEEYIKNNIKDYYIIRPPYLYGPMNNVYREAFLFECMDNNMSFYIPKDGKLKLQFFYIGDLAKFILKIIELKPKDRIYNVGNKDIIDVNEWVNLCQEILNKKTNIVYINDDVPQRSYFPFLDYSYTLDIKKQGKILKELTPLKEGLIASYNWYKDNKNLVRRKPLIEFINDNYLN